MQLRTAISFGTMIAVSESDRCHGEFQFQWWFGFKGPVPPPMVGAPLNSDTVLCTTIAAVTAECSLSI